MSSSRASPLLVIVSTEGNVKKESRGKDHRKRGLAKKGAKVGGRGPAEAESRRGPEVRPRPQDASPRTPACPCRAPCPGSSPPTASRSMRTTSDVSFAAASAPDSERVVLSLLNQGPVAVDPYEEARGPGEPSRPRTSRAPPTALGACGPSASASAATRPSVTSCYADGGRERDTGVLRDPALTVCSRVRARAV